MTQLLELVVLICVTPARLAVQAVIAIFGVTVGRCKRVDAMPQVEFVADVFH